MKIRCLAGLAVMTLAIVSSAEAAWVYTETNTVANGVSQGSLTDGVWTFYATRAKNSATDLSVDAKKGMSIATESLAPIDFTEVVNQDGSASYKVVSFAFALGNRASPLAPYITEFVAPDCTSLSGEGCFKSCTNLKKIILNENATAGSGRMFEGCSSLAELYPRRFPSSGSFSFSGCSSLAGRIELYEATSVASSMFNGCSLLEEIVAPKATAVGERGFQNCSGLTNVVLSAQLEKLQDWAFDGCTELCEESIRRLLHKGLAQWGNNTTTNIRGGFSGCLGLMELVLDIPNLATNVVPSDCFKNCSSLGRVDFKSDIAEIRGAAFYDIKPGAELYMPAAVPSLYGGAAVATQNAPYPRIYLQDNFDGWLDVMYVDAKNHVIRRSEFNDASWVSKHRSDLTWSGVNPVRSKMLADTTMTVENEDGTVKILDNKVLGFITWDNNKAGCWILKAPKPGMSVIVR